MKDFISYELAKKLENKGFDCDNNYGYNDKGCICVPVYNIDDDQLMTMTPCPEIHEVLKWLRKEKNLFVSPSLYKKGYEPYIQSTIFEDRKDYTDMWRINKFYASYEEAVISGIEYALDNLI